VQALTQAVKSTESARAAIEAGFQVGTRTSVDVLDAEQNLFRAKRDLAVARYNYIIDTLTLKQAAGTLSEEDVRLVNAWLQ
jgi:outer membrane protein